MPIRLRQSWDTYFMRLAHLASERATCDRKHVGCVLVKSGRVVATGYNGSLPGQDHCDDVGHDMLNGHCVRTVHAEVNAVAQAAKTGVSLEGAWAYLNTYPCWNCAKIMIASGVRRFVYDDAYRVDERVERAVRAAGGSIYRAVLSPETPEPKYAGAGNLDRDFSGDPPCEGGG